MTDKIIWLVGFIIDVIVFSVACGALMLHFLVTETLYNVFCSLVLVLLLEPEEAFSLLKWWAGSAKKYTISCNKILFERLAKSYKEPVILRKDK